MPVLLGAKSEKSEMTWCKIILLFVRRYSILGIGVSWLPKGSTKELQLFITLHFNLEEHYITQPFSCNSLFSSGTLKLQLHSGVNQQQNHRTGTSSHSKTGQQTPNPSESAFARWLDSRRRVSVLQMRAALLWAELQCKHIWYNWFGITKNKSNHWMFYDSVRIGKQLHMTCFELRYKQVLSLHKLYCVCSWAHS